MPDLTPRLGDEPAHVAACLFPVEDGEDLSKSRPSIGADQRVIETGLVAGS